jgi:plastocyanin domain-containing protein
MKSAAIAVTLAALLGAAVAVADPRHIDIAVTKRGFEPDRISVVKGQEIELAFTRKTDATCAKQVTIEVGDGTTVTKDLPLDTPVAVKLAFKKTGELHYACGMDMVHGVVVVQ